MAIKIIGVGKSLITTANDVVYTPPADVVSATIAAGCIENLSGVAVNVNLRIGGVRNLYVIRNKPIAASGAPLVLPAFTLNPGERLEAWSSASGLDLTLTVGEQR